MNIQDTKLNWRVEEHSIVIESDGTKINTHKALIKSDTRNVLGIVGNKYTVYQNDQLLDFASQVAAGTNAKIINSGLYRKGRDVFLQLDLGDEVFPFGDIVKNFATFRNLHDGSGKLAAYPGNIRIYCKNTFTMSYRTEGEDGISFTHTSGIYERVEEFILRVQNIRKQNVRFAEFADVLSKKKASHYDDLVNITKLIGGSEKVQGNNLNDLITSLNHPTNQNIIGSVWGTFNAVTHWATHNRKIKKTSDREYDSMFGIGNDIKNKAFEYLKQAYAA